MEDRISTYQITDLKDIFSEDAQETEETGGARILYTFDENKAPTRERVGEQFILDVQNPPVTIFVTAPIVGNISEGTAVVSDNLDGVQDRYPLSSEGVEGLISDVAIETGFGSEDDIEALLDEESKNQD